MARVAGAVPSGMSASLHVVEQSETQIQMIILQSYDGMAWHMAWVFLLQENKG
jgi:hypothetical protein